MLYVGFVFHITGSRKMEGDQDGVFQNIFNFSIILQFLIKCPTFQVFEGDDGERFEKNWLYWTGARMIYRHLPHNVGMRKIALHKSVASQGDKMYLLVCECANLMDNLSGAAMLITALRARLCGYTGLYRPIQTFQSLGTYGRHLWSESVIVVINNVRISILDEPSEHSNMIQRVFIA